MTYESSERKPSIYQAITINFQVCRDAYHVYEQWIKTGIQPQLAPLPQPIHPEEPGWTLWTDEEYPRFKGAADSGEPANLLAQLQGEGTCGEWIPAEPGGSETIAQRLKQ